jgi:hypothetical protein
MTEFTKTIRLTKYVADPVLHSNQHAWPLTVVASGVNMPDEVFVYRANGTADAVEGDTFHNVASVHDLYEFPKEGNIHQDETTRIPYYRRNEVNFMLRNPKEIDYIWNEIQADVTELIENYALDDSLKSAGSVEISVDSPNSETVIIPAQATSYIKTLSSYPIGSLDVETPSGSQIIVAPYNFENAGWVSPDQASTLGLAPVPENTRFIYHLVEEDLKPFFPGLKKSQIELKLNGKILPQDIVYTVADNTIVWLDFTEEQARNLGLESNLPWTLDYVDLQNPGDNPNELVAYINL